MSHVIFCGESLKRSLENSLVMFVIWTVLLKIALKAREVAQQLTALGTFARDPGLVSRTHMVAYNPL